MVKAGIWAFMGIGMDNVIEWFDDIFTGDRVFLVKAKSQEGK